jgi:multiple sugar transport system permease protein
MSAISELSQLKVSRGATREQRRAAKKAAGRDNKAAYLFLLPWLVGLVVITIGPMIASLYLSFTDYSLIEAPKWVGLANFTHMLHDPRLHQSLRVTFTYVLVGVPLQLLVALAIALLLDKGMRGLAFYRSVFYLPSMLGSSVAIAVLWRQIFGVDGLVNQVLRAFGVDAHTGWISDPQYALWTLVLLHIWTFGSPMVIFLAGLRQIPGMYYEAASVDGAPWWRQFRSITLPLLSPIIFFNLVLQVIGFGELKMGYAAAMAWMLVIIVGATTALNFFLSKYWVFYDD